MAVKIHFDPNTLKAIWDTSSNKLRMGNLLGTQCEQCTQTPKNVFVEFKNLIACQSCFGDGGWVSYQYNHDITLSGVMFQLPQWSDCKWLTSIPVEVYKYNNGYCTGSYTVIELDLIIEFSIGNGGTTVHLNAVYHYRNSSTEFGTGIFISWRLFSNGYCPQNETIDNDYVSCDYLIGEPVPVCYGGYADIKVVL